MEMKAWARKLVFPPVYEKASHIYRRMGGAYRSVGSLAFRGGIRAIRSLRRKPLLLFERASGIGDIICTFPSVLALRKRHPDAVVVYATRKAFKGIVNMGQVADYVVESDWSEETPKVRTQDYDLHFQPWLEDEMPRGREHAHLVDDFAQTLGVSIESRQPVLHTPKAAAQKARGIVSMHKRDARFAVGIHIGPSWKVREWKDDGWEALTVLLQTKLNCTVLQLGSDVDTTKGKLRTIRIPGAVDCIDKFTLTETVAVLEQLDLMIGIDSGLLHMSGAVNTPCVGLFGPINARLRLPPKTPSRPVTVNLPCLGCHHRLPIIHWKDGCPHDIACMRTIEPTEVLEAAASLLSD